MKHGISKSWILTTIILMDLLAGMEFDLFVPSFPELQSHFSLSPFLVESLLLITIAFLPFIISQIIPSTMLVPLALNFIPHAKGRISAILQGSQLIFAALSLELAGYFYQGSFKNIGIIIAFFILMVIVTHFFVLKNSELMKLTQE